MVSKEKYDFPMQWENTDQVLLVETKPLHVHRSILSLWSPVFSRMFNGDFKEKNSSEVTLPGKSYDEITEMLKVVYDRRYPITGKSLCISSTDSAKYVLF